MNPCDRVVDCMDSRNCGLDELNRREQTKARTGHWCEKNGQEDKLEDGARPELKRVVCASIRYVLRKLLGISGAFVAVSTVLAHITVLRQVRTSLWSVLRFIRKSVAESASNNGLFEIRVSNILESDRNRNWLFELKGTDQLRPMAGHCRSGKSVPR